VTRTFRSVALALGVLLLPEGLFSQEPGFKLIVNAGRTATSIRRPQLVEIFLRKVTRWGDGASIEPVDLSTKSPVRASFSKEGLGQSVDAVVNYWQKQILSRGERPPVVKSSDEEVIAFVSSSPGAIGYVAPGAALPDKVKVLKLTE